MWYPRSIPFRASSCFQCSSGAERDRLPDLIDCGDDKGAKRTAARAMYDVGFKPVHAGPVVQRPLSEPFSLLVAQLAYDGSDGPRINLSLRTFRKAANVNAI
jgi:predicted dinucleotide-binding enzyme